MRKFLSLVLAVLMVVSVTVIAASAEGTGTATVTITGFNNESTDQQTYQVGEEITAYVALNCSELYDDGMIGAMKAIQYYDSSVLELTDAYGTDGMIKNLANMFPVIGAKGSTVANAKNAGKITFNASIPSTTDAYQFDSDDTMLIIAHYRVKAAGTATISNEIVTLATPDFYMTKAVNNSVVINDKFTVTVSLSEPAVPAGSTVSGSITSFHSDTDEITVQLLSGTEVAYSTTATGNSATYSIEGVADGTYTLSVSKKDHVTREYEVVVSGDTTQNAKIHLIGDINGDAKISTVDYAQVNACAKGAKDITDPYLRKVVDLNKDGKITTIDAARVNAAAKGANPLW